MDNVGELARRVNFPVYQDTQRTLIWNQLGGGKDDTLIYDRCGKLTHHIRYPRSLLSKRHFQVALWDTYYSNPCDCDPATINAARDNHQSAGHQAVSNNNNQPRRHGERNHGHNHNHNHQGSQAGNQHHHQSHHGQHAGSRHHRSAHTNRQRNRRHVREEIVDEAMKRSGESNRMKSLGVKKHNAMSPKFRNMWHNILFHHRGYGPKWK